MKCTGLMSLTAATAALLGLGLLLPSGADARTERLVWQMPAPGQAAGFDILVGGAPSSYHSVLNVGRPGAAGATTFAFDLQVPDADTVYVAVRAYASDGLRSDASNESVRAGSAPAGSAAAAAAAPPGGSSLTTASLAAPGTATGSGSLEAITTGSPGASGTGGAGLLESTGGAGPSLLPDLRADPDPGVPDSLWADDFESHPLGSRVSGWLDTGRSYSLIEDDAIFEVVDVAGNRVLTTASADTDIHSHYRDAASPTWRDYELTGALSISDPRGGVGVTAYSQFPAADAYVRLGRYATGAFAIGLHPSIACDTASTEVLPTPGRWYRFRLRVEAADSRTRVRARVWPADQTESAGWQAECSDAGGALGAGTVGAWSMGAGAKFWDDLEVTLLNGATTPGAKPTSPPGEPILLPPGEQ